MKNLKTYEEITLNPKKIYNNYQSNKKVKEINNYVAGFTDPKIEKVISKGLDSNKRENVYEMVLKQSVIKSIIDDNVEPKLLPIIESILIINTVDEYGLITTFMQINTNTNPFDYFKSNCSVSIKTDHIVGNFGFSNKLIYINKIRSINCLTISNLEDFKTKINNILTDLPKFFSLLKEQIIISKKEAEEANIKYKKHRSYVDDFKSRHEEVEDCLFDLIDMSETHAGKSYQNGEYEYTFTFKDINVVAQTRRVSSSRFGSTEYFKDAQFILTDELLKIFKSLSEVKPRVEYIFPNIEVKTIFSENKLTIIFYPEKSKKESRFF